MLFMDLDGTLLDVRQRHYAVYREILGQRDIRGVPIQAKDYWGHRLEAKPIDDILKASRLFPPKYKTFVERFEQRLESPDLLTLDEVRVGVTTALQKLYTKTPICLVTQRRDENALTSQLAQLGLKKFFASVLHGAPPKPRRRTDEVRAKHKIELIKKRYRIMPTEGLYIGDTERDVEVARHFGWDVFLVEGGHRTKALQIKADPDRIVVDLAAALEFMLPGGRWQR